MDENLKSGTDQAAQATPATLTPEANQQNKSITTNEPTGDPPSSDSTSPTVVPTTEAEIGSQAPVASVPLSPPTHSAGNIVLQWLTYAFWGWTVLATSVLVGTVFANLIFKSDTGGFMPYGIAAVLVLLPISIACDFFYSKQEPAKKTGATSIVMVIHAVLFALFAIGALITAVISVILIFTSSSDPKGAETTLLSALVIVALYVLTFLRTINPVRFPFVRRFYPVCMVAVVGIFAVLGIVGPMANAHRTKDDKLIEDNLSSIQSQIGGYVVSKHTLPASLDNLELQGDDAKLAKLVQYKPNTKPAKSNLSTSLNSSSTVDVFNRGQSSPGKTYYYQLCVTFTEKSSDYRPYDGYSTSYTKNDDGYSDYLSVYSHPAGPMCYKLSSSTDTL